jgi:cytochrome c biogenesis protein CcmG, thiol:disulfide interchange protein DsbE
MIRSSRSLQRVTLAVLLCCARLGAQAPSEVVGKAAPLFVRSDLSGNAVDLNKYRGRVVLLNFWATWCAPCQVELPQFEAWQKKYRAEGLKVIAVSMDDGDTAVRRTVRRLHLHLPVVMGDAQLGEAYGGVLGLPITFLIDRKGKIVAQFKGETDLTSMESQIKQLLAR